jgi:hypothetical protein
VTDSRDWIGEDAFAQRKGRLEAVLRDLWHPLHAHRVGLPALDAALGQLERVLRGEVGHSDGGVGREPESEQKGRAGRLASVPGSVAEVPRGTEPLAMQQDPGVELALRGKAEREAGHDDEPEPAEAPAVSPPPASAAPAAAAGEGTFRSKPPVSKVGRQRGWRSKAG